MSLTCIILDAPIGALFAPPCAGGVLDLPLSGGSLLDFHCRRLEGAPIDRIVVLRRESAVVAPRFCGSWLTVMDAAVWVEFIERIEPADMLVLIDGRRVLPHGDDLAPLLAAGAQTAPVIHLLSHASAHGGIDEFAELDGDRRLLRLRRRFHGVTHHAGSIVIGSRLSAGILRDAIGAEYPDLGALRRRLSGLGVPSIDRSSELSAVDAGTPAGVLELIEHRFAAQVDMRTSSRTGNGAATAARSDAMQSIDADACVDASARLIGAVVVHAGAQIGPGCRIIGPSVIGARALVGSGALLSRACVWPGAAVTANSQIVDQIVVGDVALPPGPGFSPALTTPLRCTVATRPMGWMSRGCKRTADIVLSIGGLLLLSPVLALLAALIRITSPGPIFFGHEREGRDGRRFVCWKFRTMVPDAHARQRELYGQNKVDGPQFKLDRDPRVTPVGDFLRKSNLDELPQLFNVLLGDMSLIGPRPSPFRENQLCMPWRRSRLAVQPGITGLWQVCRHDRGESDFYQWIYFDNLYVEHQSIRLDLAILFVTLVTLGGRWPVPVDWLISSKARGRGSPQKHADSTFRPSGLTGVQP